MSGREREAEKLAGRWACVGIGNKHTPRKLGAGREMRKRDKRKKPCVRGERN